MSVTFLPEVRKYFESLALILYEKGYFSFKETGKTSIKYATSQATIRLHSIFN